MRETYEALGVVFGALKRLAIADMLALISAAALVLLIAAGVTLFNALPA